MARQPIILPEPPWSPRLGSVRGIHPAGALSPWTPAALKPLIWLDAADVSSVIITGGVVSDWRDKSNGYVFTQGTAGRRPVVESYNNIPVVSFYNDATNAKHLDCAFTYAGNTLSWVTVNINQTGYNSQSLYGRLWSHFLTGESDYNTNNAIIVTYGAVAGKASLYRNGAAIASTPDSISGSWNILSAYRNGTAGGISSNGSAFATGSTASANQNFDLTRIGNDTARVDSGLYGSIAETMLFTRALSDAEFWQVQGYLAHKWGLAALLPSSHPYKAMPPMQSPQTQMTAYGVNTFNPAWALNTNQVIL